MSAQSNIVSETWSLGVKIGLPVVILLLLVGLAFLIGGVIVLRKRWGSYLNDGWPLLGIGAVVVVATVGGAAWGFYPYKASYHKWYEISGTVDTVGDRLISAGDKGGSNQKFVVSFREDGTEYGCNDTRCSLIKPGDHLTLTCKRVWQYTGRDGWDCNFVERRGGAA